MYRLICPVVDAACGISKLEPFFEYTRPNGPNKRLSADIALMGEDSQAPIWLIEAKKYDRKIDPGMIDPYLNPGAMGVVTNGNQWIFKVRGRWMYLYRAIDSVGDTVEFWFNEQRDLPAAKRFFRKALDRHGRPDRVVIDGSQTNREAIISCDAESRLRDRSRQPLRPIRIRNSKYLNNRIEQDHRRIKRRVRPMMGFKSFSSATVTLAGIEMVHMMRKRQGRFPFNPAPSLKVQFDAIVA
jgi:hypothetical protein